MILENVSPLINHRLGGIGLNTRLEIGVICLNNLRQLVGQIILRTLIVILNHGRTHLGRGDGKHCANHPIWTTPIAAEAHEIHILIKNTAEETKHKLHLQRLALLVSCALGRIRRRGCEIGAIPLSHDAGNPLTSVTSGLTSTTAVLRLLPTALNLLGRREHISPPCLALALQEMLAELLVHEQL